MGVIGRVVLVLGLSLPTFLSLVQGLGVYPDFKVIWNICSLGPLKRSWMFILDMDVCSSDS